MEIFQWCSCRYSLLNDIIWHISYCTYYIPSASNTDWLCAHTLASCRCWSYSWDSQQEIDSSRALFSQRDAAMIWGRYTFCCTFVSCRCQRSHALTYCIRVGCREDRLLNKWPLSHKGRQLLMSLSTQLARFMSSLLREKKRGLYQSFSPLLNTVALNVIMHSVSWEN